MNITLERLGVRLEKAFEQFGRVRKLSLTAARGYWTHAHQDVRQVEGVLSFHGDVKNYSVGSWESATTLMRRGFEIQDCRQHLVVEVDFEIFKKD